MFGGLGLTGLLDILRFSVGFRSYRIYNYGMIRSRTVIVEFRAGSRSLVSDSGFGLRFEILGV